MYVEGRSQRNPMDSNIPHTLDEDFMNKRPFAFEIEGTRIEVKTWNEMVTKTCEILFKKDPQLFLGLVDDSKFHGTKWTYFSWSPKDMSQPKKVNGTEIYVETKMNANKAINLIKRMIQRFNISAKDYKIYLRTIQTSQPSEDHCAKGDEQLKMGTVTTANGEQVNTSIRRVDFNHTELCADCNPATCTVNGEKIPVGNWRDLLMTLIAKFTTEVPDKINELYSRPLLSGSSRPFLLKEKPNGTARQTATGHWVYVNFNISALADLIGKLCQYCGVKLNDVEITYTPKSSVRSGDMARERNESSTVYAEQNIRAVLRSVISAELSQNIRAEFRAWLTEQHPDWSSNTVTMHYSDAYYLYNNERGVTLEEALTAEDGLQRAYDVIERFYTDNPTQTNNPSGSARGYLRSLRMLREFLDEKYPGLLGVLSVVGSAPSVPDVVIDVLSKNYASGFRFDTTYINLLSSTSGVEVDGRMQSALKRIMFRRDDGIFFLLDIVADAATRKDIVDFADSYLQEYGCFEIPEFYKLCEEKVNPNCIRNAEDFESFYEQIGKSGVRCVQAPYIGNRIARYSNGAVWSTFKEVSAKIVSVITEEYYGSCNEDDLQTRFCAFSTDLLGKIIRQCAAEELIRVEINGSVCYQTFDALGLPDNFSDVLAEALERLSDIGLEPTQDVLHTAISLKLGINFKAEYNLPAWDTYRRLIAAFYKAEPHREWKCNIFGEVAN